MSPRPTALSWPDLLDALEEHTRRVAERLDDPEADPAPDVDLVADGPLPEALASRARALLAETRRLERLAETRLDRTRRALHYAAL